MLLLRSRLKWCSRLWHMCAQMDTCLSRVTNGCSLFYLFECTECLMLQLSCFLWSSKCSKKLNLIFYLFLMFVSFLKPFKTWALLDMYSKLLLPSLYSQLFARECDDILYGKISLLVVSKGSINYEILLFLR